MAEDEAGHPPKRLDTRLAVDQAAAVAEERAGTTTGTRRGSRLAIAGVVLGGAAIVVGLFSVIGWVLGLAAIVVSAVAVRRDPANRGVAIWGSWLGVAGSVLTALVFALLVTGR